MADNVETGIKLEAEGEQEFSTSLEKAAGSLDTYSTAAENASGKTSALGEALDQAKLDESRAANMQALAEQTAAIADGIARQAEGVAKLVGAFFDAADETAEYGDTIDKMSQKLGLSRRAYQEWSYILNQSGSSIGKAKSAMQQLAKVQEGLTKTAADDLAALGLSLEDVQSLSREELFSTVITGLQGMEESSERAMLAQRLLGSSYKELMPLLNTSTEETEALRQLFYKLGGYMDDEAVDAAVAYGDSVDDINLKWGAFKRNIFSQFLPALTQLREDVIDNGALDRLADKIGSLAEKGVGGLSWLVDHSEEAVNAVVTIGEAWAAWKGAEIVGQVVTNVRQLYGWLSTLGGVLGVGAAGAAGLVGTTALGVARVVSYTSELNNAGFLGKGHELEEYAANLTAAEEALAQWHAQYDEYINSGYTEGVDALNQELGVLEAAVRNAREEYEAMQAAQESAAETTAQAGEQTAQAADTVSEKSSGMLETVTETAGEISTNFAEGVDEMSTAAAEAVVNTNDVMGQNMAILSANADIWGQDMMISFANGITSGYNSWVLPALDEIAGGITDRIGFSEPKIGPLSDFHTFAPDMMTLFAEGVLANKWRVTDAITDAFDISPYMASGAAAPSISYGGVNVTFQVQPGQDGRALFEEFSYWLQNEMAEERAVYAQ